MEPRLMDVLQGKEDNYILPFFWQHGESKELLEEGMQRIYDSGIKAVCVESRPHPDFVGEGWWRAVSYTHLDVYKRQVLYLFISSS